MFHASSGLKALVVFCALYPSVIVAAQPSDYYSAGDVLSALIDDNAARWLASAPTANGFFQTSLDRYWNPTVGAYSNGIAQPRQLYVMAAGYRYTGDPNYKAALDAGLAFMNTYMNDPVHGGYFWEIEANGSVRNDAKDAYGHGLVMFSMANAYRATGDSNYLSVAQGAFNTLTNHFVDSYGGYSGNLSRDFSTVNYGPGLNHMMHVFEPMIQLYEVSRDPAVLAEARRLGNFILNRMYQDHPTQIGRGYIPDAYNSDWSVPADYAHGGNGYVNLGHNIEMSYLISRAVEAGIADDPDAWLAKAGKVRDFVLAHGYDSIEGGMDSPNCDYDGNLQHPTWRESWWEQCEITRATLHWSAVRGEDLWDEFELSYQFLTDHFADATYGGFFEDRDGATKPWKGSIWKAGYHETMLFEEMLRLIRPGGDGNWDFVVDDADYTIWADNYNAEAGWSDIGDYNGDGAVDDADYTVWADSYGQSASAPTPEPASAALALIGMTSLLARRRR